MGFWDKEDSLLSWWNINEGAISKDNISITLFSQLLGLLLAWYSQALNDNYFTFLHTKFQTYHLHYRNAHRLLCLKYILEQNEESNLQKMLKLQIENPTKGDWAPTCLNVIQELNLEMSFEEIKFMTKQKFTNILKEEMKKSAFRYLHNKCGKKGEEIQGDPRELRRSMCLLHRRRKHPGT